jgi:hypothetical protein
MTSSNHSHASATSQELCDSLFAALGRVLPELQRNKTKGSCGVFLQYVSAAATSKK